MPLETVMDAAETRSLSPMGPISWSHRVSLARGRNVILVRAINNAAEVSPLARVVIHQSARRD